MNRTLSEIAREYGVTRQAIYDRIRKRKIVPDGKVLIGGRWFFNYSPKLQKLIMADRKMGRPKKSVQNNKKCLTL